MKKLFALVLSLCALSLATAAKADPIGGPGSNCVTCQGATYTLFTDFNDLDGTAGGVTYRVSLFIDTSTYTGGGGFIDTVAIKIASDITGFALVSAPAGSGPWQTYSNTGLNANGCSGGGSGFGCASTLPDAGIPFAGGTAATVGGNLEWVFDISFAAGDLIDPASIKVRYSDAATNGGKVGDLVSENIELQRSPCVPGTPGCEPPFLVPEPDTLALLGMAFFLVALATNRRRKG